MIKKNDKKTPVLVILATILFLVLAFIRLGSTSLWLDEIMSMDFCDSSFSECLYELANDVHAPLFYLVLNIWLRIFGLSELIGRVPGVLAGAGSIIALFFLAREVRNTRTALASCFILAISPFFLEFSREIHPYSQSALFSILSWYFLIRIMKRGKRVYALSYGLVTGCLLLTFYPSFLVVLSQFLFLIFQKISRRKKKTILLGWVLSALLFFPWLPVFLKQLGENKIGPVMNIYFPGGIKPVHIIFYMGDLLFGTSARKLGPPFIIILLAVLCCASILVYHKETRATRHKKDRTFLILVFWMFPGIAILFGGVSLIKPMLFSRYMTMSIPFAALFYGILISRLKGIGYYVLILLLTAVFLISYTCYLKEMPREDWKGSAEYLSENIQSLDIVVADHMNSVSCLDYYFKILGRKDLQKNVFPYNMFLEHTGGAYPFPDRTLWYLSLGNEINQDQLGIIRKHNIEKSSVIFLKNYQIYAFKGKPKP